MVFLIEFFVFGWLMYGLSIMMVMSGFLDRLLVRDVEGEKDMVVLRM